MPTVIAVRLKHSAKQLWFDPGETGASTGDHVVVKTERGTEMGLACSDAFEVKKSDLRAALKPVLRVATDDDLERADHLAHKGKDALPVFRELARKSGLDMKPVDVEFLFGGEKAVFYFTAEERVDFRQLVRELASTFHIRIDMRQIGVRDETQLVGGIAPCGQELCCVRLGGKFKPVSIRMAKEQDLSLNPLKISGFCGRLMCCLRYEYEAYKDFKSRAPKKNALIETPLGLGKVTGFDTPRELVTLRLEDGLVVTVPLAEMGYKDGTVAGDYDDHAPAKPETRQKGAQRGQAGEARSDVAGDGGTNGEKTSQGHHDDAPSPDDAEPDASEAHMREGQARPAGEVHGAGEDMPSDGHPAQAGAADGVAPRLCPATASGKPPCPGRPCIVTRKSLELHGNTQVALALAAYDREHGIVSEDDYSDDLVDEVKQRPKARRRRATKGKDSQQTHAEGGRRRAGQTSGTREDGKDAGGAQQRRRRPRKVHGGSEETASATSAAHRAPRRRHRAGEAEARQDGHPKQRKDQSQQHGRDQGHEGSHSRGPGHDGRREGARPRPGQHSSSTHGQGPGRKAAGGTHGQARKDAGGARGARQGHAPAGAGANGSGDQMRASKSHSGSGSASQRRRRRTHPGSQGAGHAAGHAQGAERHAHGGDEA